MTIDEKTRKRRVVRWKAQKSAWESKLAEAANENDTAVAKAMIAQAESAIKRLEVKDKVVREEDTPDKQNIDPITKKIKADRKKITKSTVHSTKAKDSTDAAQ